MGYEQNEISQLQREQITAANMAFAQAGQDNISSAVSLYAASISARRMLTIIFVVSAFNY